MTPTQLRSFAAIARHGSARAAARELGVSEAAISSHTAALRKEQAGPAREGVSLGDAVRTRQFWMLVGIFAICGLNDFFVSTHVVAFAQDRYLFTWQETPGFPGRGRLYTTDLQPIGGSFSLPGAELVASDGTDFMVNWFAREPGAWYTLKGIKVNRVHLAKALHPNRCGAQRIWLELAPFHAATFFLGDEARRCKHPKVL